MDYVFILYHLSDHELLCIDIVNIIVLVNM